LLGALIQRIIQANNIYSCFIEIDTDRKPDPPDPGYAISKKSHIQKAHML